MDSVESALRFLQRSFASAANEEAQWREEKAQLQAQVRELERERSVQEEAYRDALIRVKMLEFALRQVRIVSATNSMNQYVSNIFLVL